MKIKAASLRVFNFNVFKKVITYFIWIWDRLYR